MPTIHAKMEKEVQSKFDGLAHFETPKKIALLEHDFSVESRRAHADAQGQASSDRQELQGGHRRALRRLSRPTPSADRGARCSSSSSTRCAVSSHTRRRGSSRPLRRMDGRHIVDGTLGCPVCRREYPIRARRRLVLGRRAGRSAEPNDRRLERGREARHASGRAPRPERRRRHRRARRVVDRRRRRGRRTRAGARGRAERARRATSSPQEVSSLVVDDRLPFGTAIASRGVRRSASMAAASLLIVGCRVAAELAVGSWRRSTAALPGGVTELARDDSGLGRRASASSASPPVHSAPLGVRPAIGSSPNAAGCVSCATAAARPRSRRRGCVTSVEHRVGDGLRAQHLGAWRESRAIVRIDRRPRAAYRPARARRASPGRPNRESPAAAPRAARARRYLLGGVGRVPGKLAAVGDRADRHDVAARRALHPRQKRADESEAAQRD